MRFAYSSLNQAPEESLRFKLEQNVAVTHWVLGYEKMRAILLENAAFCMALIQVFHIEL